MALEEALAGWQGLAACRVRILPTSSRRATSRSGARSSPARPSPSGSAPSARSAGLPRLRSANPGGHGVWGGLNETERRAILRRKALEARADGPRTTRLRGCGRSVTRTSSSVSASWASELPELPEPVASYVTVKRAGSPGLRGGTDRMVDGHLLPRAGSGQQVSVAMGQEAAARAGLQALSAIRHHLGGSFDRLVQLLQVTVFVAADASSSNIPRSRTEPATRSGRGARP